MFFYSFWNYKFCALMALSTGVSYVAGLGFLRWEDPRRRKLCLLIPITFDLALLAFFKYINFGISMFNGIGGPLFDMGPAPELNIIVTLLTRLQWVKKELPNQQFITIHHNSSHLKAAISKADRID
jgi:D-alanyl-lipoteichoic acid acyltransferase DltB (MBOAT superfamily)